VRIALVSNVLPQVGGVSTFVDALADGLRQQGHKVDIIGVFGARRTFRYIPARALHPLLVLFRLPLAVAAAYYATQAWLAVMLCCAQLRNHYDVLHAQDVSAANVASLCRRPLVLTMHGFLSRSGVGGSMPPSWLARAFARAERTAFARADVVVAVSEDGRDFVTRRAPGAKVEVIRNLVPERFLVGTATTSRPGQDLRVLFAGRLVREKGVHLLLQAIARLTTHKIELTVAGDGPEREPLTRQARGLGLERVRFMGEVPPADMPRIIADTDVVVIPSLADAFWTEGTPMILLEAMAGGKCVLASDSGGIRDVIADDANGVLVAANDPNALALALERLAADASLRRRLAGRAREYVTCHHSLQAITNAYIGVYEQVAKIRR